VRHHGKGKALQVQQLEFSKLLQADNVLFTVSTSRSSGAAIFVHFEVVRERHFV